MSTGRSFKLDLQLISELQRGFHITLWLQVGLGDLPCKYSDGLEAGISTSETWEEFEDFLAIVALRYGNHDLMYKRVCQLNKHGGTFDSK